MKKWTCAVLAACAATAAPAAAEGLYAGAGYIHYDAEGADLGAATARGGYEFRRHLAVEGEVGTGVADDGGVELDSAWGVYGVGKVPLGREVEVFARLGYQGVDTGGADDDGAGYGLGAQWNFTDRFGLRADYTRLDGDDEVDTVGVSGVMKF